MIQKVAGQRVILGIDPGTSVMGYGVIRADGSQLSLIAMGVLELQKYPDHYTKLSRIFERVTQLINSYNPSEMAIEAPFHGKNVQSMLKLGRAQGVAMAAALSNSVPVFEYAPLRVKQAITGMGNASKEQVALFLIKYLNLDDGSTHKYFDSTDGLATAVCHYFQGGSRVVAKGSKSWKEFINKNPGRLR